MDCRVEVWETRPGPHSHIICGVASREKARALRKSVSRSKVLAEVNAKPVYDRPGLVEYLFGEMSSTARFRDANRVVMVGLGRTLEWARRLVVFRLVYERTRRGL